MTLRSKPLKKPEKEHWPWHHEPRDDAAIFAFQAFTRGNANPGQQQRAYAYLCQVLCEVDRMTFWPGGEEGRRATDFAEGKRWVALQIRRMVNMRPDHRDRENP